VVVIIVPVLVGSFVVMAVVKSKGNLSSSKNIFDNYDNGKRSGTYTSTITSTVTITTTSFNTSSITGTVYSIYSTISATSTGTGIYYNVPSGTRTSR
jgi:hypothetical protein